MGRVERGEGRPASGEQKRGEVGRETSTHTHTGRQTDGWTEGDRERKRGMGGGQGP